MATVSQSLNVTTSQSIQPMNLPGSVTQLTNAESFRCNTANGTSADQIDLLYTTTLTFSASTPQVLNLKALTAPDGTAIAFARVRTIWVAMKGVTDGQALTLGYGTTTANAWTSLLSNPGTLAIPASTTSNQAVAVFTAPNTTGWAVGTSNRLLQLDPGTGAFSVDITIAGAST